MDIGGATSRSEKEYILLGVEQGIRTDGRGRLDYRPVAIETNILPQTNGSARVTISHGATTVIAASKVEVGKPDPRRPREGRVSVGAEVSNALFPRADDRANLEANAELASALTRIIVNSDTLDLEQLCIIPGKFCWVIHLDVLILSSNGNILDPASMAAYVTLNTTRIPKTTVFELEGGGGQDFDISSDFADAELVPGADLLPVAVTLAKVGAHWVVDAAGAEEGCAGARVAVAANRRGKICGVRPAGAAPLAAGDLPLLVGAAARAAAAILERAGEIGAATGSEKEFAFQHRGLLGEN